MHEHNFSIVVEGSREEVWDLFWYRGDDRPQSKDVKIDVLHPGNELGEGLIRHCTFRVPRFLLSGGIGHSWEWLTEVEPYESWKYDAVGKPLWSKGEGWTRLEDLGDGRARVHFRERYYVFNPLMRFALERYVHNYISRANDKELTRAVNGGLRWLRAKRARES